DRFVFPQRMQCVRAALVFLGFIVGLRNEPAAALLQRFDTELLFKESREMQPHGIQAGGRILYRLRQGPAPSLAVGFGRIPTLRDFVKYRLSFRIDRSTVVFAVIEMALIVIRQG